MTVNQTISKLVDKIYPPVCVLCGASGQSDHRDETPNQRKKYQAGVDICSACESDLIQNPQACYQCAIPLPADVAGDKLRCGACLRAPPAFTHTHASYEYCWPMDKLIQAFKFQGDLAIGRVLSALMQKQIKILAAEAMPTAIISIPLHHSRLHERGFNQSALLAADLAKGLETPLLGNFLLREKPSPPQSELDAKSRKKNIRGVFSLNPQETKLPGHVVLVDDVMTTGSTLSEAAGILLAGGVKRVDCWVIARAPKPG
ncbi:MAG: ComF family protein [Xanthomonadales bacterium]|nr:ComF family protein [Xanthomonadales bacterium]